MAFSSLGQGVYLSNDGKPREAAINPEHPTIIIIFGWMGAQLPHLHKYTTIHEERYPDSAKILIRTEPSFFWSTKKGQAASLMPIVKALEALGCISKHGSNSSTLREHRILLHVFSNGGGYKLAALSQLLSSNNYTSHPTRPRSAIILDSCPGELNDISHIRRALRGAVPNPLARFVANTIATIIFHFAALYSLIFSKSILLDFRAQMNSPLLLPWTHLGTPRVYVYSKIDKLVGWSDVEAHARDATRAGFTDVRMELFEASPHVAHSRTDPERYWNIVSSVWRDAR